MQIGDTLYIHDGNCRIYEDDAGMPSRSPNPRKMYRRCAIVGETRDSWVLSGGLKISKKTLELRGQHVALGRFAFTPEQMEDTLWRETHAWKIRDAILSADTPTLRKIDALLRAEALDL
jgi:hypothetical protein